MKPTCGENADEVSPNVTGSRSRCGSQGDLLSLHEFRNGWKRGTNVEEKGAEVDESLQAAFSQAAPRRSSSAHVRLGDRINSWQSETSEKEKKKNSNINIQKRIPCF